MKTYQKWTVADVAFIKYAQYKSFTTREIAKVVDRTPASVGMMSWQIKRVEAGKDIPGAQTTDLIVKALQLEFRVRSGELNDEREKWTAQLNRVRGIETVFSKPAPVAVESTPSTQVTDTSPLIHIDINITMERAVQLLTIVFGKRAS